MVLPTHYSSGCRTTTADAPLQQKAPTPPLLLGRGLEVLLKDEIIQQGEDILCFSPKFHSDPLYDELLWVVAAIWCIAMSYSYCYYMMNCYELLLLYDELLWAAPIAAIWWIAMSCSCYCYMMSCYELLLVYHELHTYDVVVVWWVAMSCYCCYMMLSGGGAIW